MLTDLETPIRCLSCADPCIYCMRFLFLSSSPRGSSSSSDRSAVSLGFRMCAMLPLLVGGAEESFSPRPAAAEPHDQFPKVSAPLLGNWGGVDGRELGFWEAFCSEYVDSDSRSR